MSDKDKDNEKSKDEKDLPRRSKDVPSDREKMDFARRAMKRAEWRHPIGAVVAGNYHRCAACGGPINDEVVLVTERLRSGDRHFVFCDRICLGNYDGW